MWAKVSWSEKDFTVLVLNTTSEETPVKPPPGTFDTKIEEHKASAQLTAPPLSTASSELRKSLLDPSPTADSLLTAKPKTQQQPALIAIKSVDESIAIKEDYKSFRSLYTFAAASVSS